jgi:hypothetical protein
MSFARIPNPESVARDRKFPLTPALSPSDGEREKTRKTSPNERKAR